MNFEPIVVAQHYSYKVDLKFYCLTPEGNLGSVTTDIWMPGVAEFWAEMEYAGSDEYAHPNGETQLWLAELAGKHQMMLDQLMHGFGEIGVHIAESNAGHFSEPKGEQVVYA